MAAVQAPQQKRGPEYYDRSEKYSQENDTREAKQAPAPQQQLVPTEAGNPMAKVNGSIGLLPRTLEEAWRFSQAIAFSDLAPKDYSRKPHNVMVAIQMGAELGLAPMAAIQNIAVINGRPSLWGDAALAVVMAHPAYEWHKEWVEGEGDNRVAYCQIQRKGHELHTVSFSVDDAKKARLWGKEGPWLTYPNRMLQMRARSWAMRDKFSDALRGLNVAEEAIDMPFVALEKPNTGENWDAGAAQAGLKAEQQLQERLQREREAEMQAPTEATAVPDPFADVPEPVNNVFGENLDADPSADPPPAQPPAQPATAAPATQRPQEEQHWSQREDSGTSGKQAAKTSPGRSRRDTGVSQPTGEQLFGKK